MFGKMDNSTPRERRHLKTRDAILVAAMQLMREKGADNLSLRAIARRIDYSPAALYEYFGSKEEIIDAVCHEGNDRLVAYLNTVPRELPLEEYIVEVGLAYIQFARENSEMFTLMFSNLFEQPQDIRLETLDPDNAFTIACQGVQAGVDQGLIQLQEGYGVVEIAYSLWALVHGMAVLQVTQLQAFPLNFSHVDRVALQVFVCGLVNYKPD